MLKASQPTFGKQLRARRIERGLSQKALAGDIVTSSYISLLETGDRVPTLDIVLQLADALHTTLEDLIGDDYRQLFGHRPNSDAPLVTELVQARSLMELGNYAGARTSLQATLDRARTSGDDDELLRVGVEFSRVLAAIADHPARLELLDSLIGVADGRSLDAVAVSLRIDRISTLRELGRLDEARGAALALVAQPVLADPAQRHELVRLLGVLISVLCEMGELQDVEALTGKLLAEADASAEPALMGRAHWLAGMAAVRLGHDADAIAELAKARELLRFDAMSVLEWLRFSRSAAGILLEAGSPDAGLTWLAAAESAVAVTDTTAERNAVKRVRAQYELAHGNTEAAATLFAELTQGDQGLTGLDLVMALRGHAQALRLLGRLDEAVQALRRAVTLYEESGSYRQVAALWREIEELREAS
ncbi:hypothetical protein Aph01nite_70850 [Acrocarpospora phusangensis]|uniref:HTH cro/C1-type domain-containing protein n=1 Tax=Acrocarpospora phusangensis TaxID=1070424 RepID=A0A919UUV5_9ACTN|nr:helix-turn-helix domain-containing protein [Acrocarpospora phusangensis]GIH28775.1 hypothetical protein Aph01nite_70850 [Acrocarpospora phusangensis]